MNGLLKIIYQNRFQASNYPSWYNFLYENGVIFLFNLNALLKFEILTKPES